jgi:hypothetical protein
MDKGICGPIDEIITRFAASRSCPWASRQTSRVLKLSKILVFLARSIITFLRLDQQKIDALA